MEPGRLRHGDAATADCRSGVCCGAGVADMPTKLRSNRLAAEPPTRLRVPVFSRNAAARPQFQWSWVSGSELRGNRGDE